MKSKLTYKIFAIIDLLIRHGKPMSIVELSQASGIERNACWRIVADLCDLGYLHKANYRSIEPGLGMIFLGQAIFTETFFPRRAIKMVTETARELKVSAALAGLFNNQIIYLHREGGHLPDFLGYPLHASNLGLCILERKYGSATALQMMLDSAVNYGIREPELGEVANNLTERISHLEKAGFAIEQNSGRYNISFPVERNGECFGLAFFDLNYPSEKLNHFIIRASLLRNELEK